ncbi:MAG: S9 family peptidase [Bacteroidales bacterium]|nr:MAG: S9 family peptidase [Bacteroidales bacterium]
MKYLTVTLLFIITITTVKSQEYNKITLENIFIENKFKQQKPYRIKSMNDGEHYTILDKYSHIISYKYSTGELTDTIFSADKVNINIAGSISDYEINNTDTRLLLVTSKQRIFRSSFYAEYYIYDLSDKSIQTLCREDRQELASFSPDGNKVAWVRNNNLYYKDLVNGKTFQLTHDGEKNRIINGKPDWVYEEEFVFTRGYEWAPDGQKIAWYRFDESQVKQFNLIKYNSVYPQVYSYKYPKAGEDNAKVSINVYDINSGMSKVMDIGADSDQYIPRIRWTNDPDKLCMIRLNRLQNIMKIFLADANTGNAEIIYIESNKLFLSEPCFKNITFLDANKGFIIMSEKDGFRHFYLYDIKGNFINHITNGNYDIDEFLGIDSGKGLLYYTSSEISPLQRHVYSVELNGKNRNQLTEKPGTNKAAFSKGFKYFINHHSSAGSPYYITVHNSAGKLLGVVEDNEILKDRIRSYGFVNKEFIKIPVSDDLELNAYLIKPADFDQAKQYPLLIYIYGGPDSQLVKDKWESKLPWLQMLVQKGYIIACIDNRGTGARGEQFRKCIYMQLGILETKDLIKSAEYLADLPYIDESRIGIYGGSYGGYLALMCLTRGAHVFSTGIAVSPVTDWRFYDNIYTERYMRRPRDNKKGYRESSVFYNVHKLKGELLLIHGTYDDNVHFQNSAELIKKLIKNNIQFETQLYPDKDHYNMDDDNAYYFYKRITEFIIRKL